MADKPALQQELDRIKARFESETGESGKTFKEARLNYLKVLERNYPVALPPEFHWEGDPYQSPDPKKALRDHIHVLRMNPTKFDVIPLARDADSLATARELMLYFARTWEMENEGRWWDSSSAEGQVGYGVTVMQYLWRGYHGEKVDAQDTRAAVKEREQKAKRRAHPFYWRERDIFGCYWLGDERDYEGPAVCFYEAILPFYEARAEYGKEGMELSMDGSGKVGWYGQDQAFDQAQGLADRNVRLIIKDERDPLGRRCELPSCDHVKRFITYYLCGENESADADKHEYKRHESPFPGCSFFVIPAEMSNQRTPHERFPSPLEPLYTETPWLNLHTTMLAAMMRNDYTNNDLTMNVGNSDPAVLAMEGMNEPYIDLQAMQDGKVQKVPGEIKRVPRPISPHLAPSINLMQERIARFMPNRFVMGNAYPEYAQGTGTAVSLGTQQAKLPYNTWLSNSDNAILKSRKYMAHAIQWWGMAEDEVKTSYYAVMTGNMRNVAVTGGAAKRGEVVEVNASTFDLDFDLMILTESQTESEQAEHWFTKNSQYKDGAIDCDELIAATGTDDVEGMKVRLDKMNLQQSLDPFFTQARTQFVFRMIYGMSGFDFNTLLERMQQQTQAPGQGPQPGYGAGAANNNYMNNARAPSPSVRLPPSAVAGPSGGAGPGTNGR